MDFLLEALTDWLKEMLVSGIMGNWTYVNTLDKKS